MSVADVLSRAKETVAELLERGRKLRNGSYQERSQYALDLVEMHLQEENPVRIDECIKLYTPDAIWEAPARGVIYQGRESIKKNYLRIFDNTADFQFEPIDRYATPDRVFVDAWARFRITGDAFDNSPLPVGTKVNMRLLHSFFIEDGLISRENGYEIWLCG
jgi:ketosteroid isomerase-like protein